jgi:peptidyl-prolyl cis-trans isomerase C
MQQIRSRFPDEQAFNAALAEQKLTVEKVRTQNRQEMAVTKLLQAEVEAKSAVTPADVEKAYRENPDAFKVPEQVRASHILIKVDEGADAAMKADALGRANSVLKSAKAGKDFAALAKEFSQDPGSAAQGGDLGFFPPGQMVGPFNDVAFSLRPGTISGIVETQFGYHIIKVVEKKPGRTVPLEEARTQIEQRLLDMNRQRHVAAFVKSLRDKAKVEVLI